MNVNAIKIACWIVSMGLTFGLVAYASMYLRELPDKQQLWDEDHVRSVIRDSVDLNVEVAEALSYDDVKATFVLANWTGVRAVKPEVTQVVDTGPKAPVYTPVSELLSIQMIQVDTSDPAQSLVWVMYKNMGIEEASANLHEGDALPEPHEYAKVVSIRVEGVEFSFEGAADRENEVVKPVDRDDGGEPLVVQVGPDGVRVPAQKTTIPVVKRDRPLTPEETIRTGHNKFVIGTNDAEYLSQNYASVLTNDVRTRVWHDPKTGRRGGIEIQEVRAGSIAERHGAQTGDIIKSINGHPVTSKQEAISFVKNNQDRYSIWEVVVENLGRERTITYESPE